MSLYFPEPYERFVGTAIAEVDLSNYVTKSDLKGVTGIDTSKVASKTALALLKTIVLKLDIDKVIIVSDDLRKLSKVEDKNVIKKKLYGKFGPKSMVKMLKLKVVVKQPLKDNMLETKKALKKGLKKLTKFLNTAEQPKTTSHKTKNTDFENKILGVTGLVVTAAANIKVTNIENEYLVLLIWPPNLLSSGRLQSLRVKYLILLIKSSNLIPI